MVYSLVTVSVTFHGHILLFLFRRTEYGKRLCIIMMSKILKEKFVAHQNTSVHGDLSNPPLVHYRLGMAKDCIIL